MIELNSEIKQVLNEIDFVKRYEALSNEYNDLINGVNGEFFGHAYPPGYSLEPGSADEPFLSKMGQKRSSVWGDSGNGWSPFGDAPWSTTQVCEQIRREQMARFYENRSMIRLENRNEQ